MISANGRRAGLKSPFSWNHDGYERTGGKGLQFERETLSIPRDNFWWSRWGVEPAHGFQKLILTRP
jgi:hypothetical protein